MWPYLIGTGFVATRQLWPCFIAQGGGMMGRHLKQEIRRITRDKIVQDEVRRIEQERAGSRSAMVPGGSPLPMPGTIFMGYDPGEGTDPEAFVCLCPLKGAGA